MAGILTGCSDTVQKETESSTEYSVEQMKQNLLDAARQMEPSDNLYFEEGLEITGLGVTYDDRPITFDGCYYWLAI